MQGNALYAVPETCNCNAEFCMYKLGEESICRGKQAFLQHRFSLTELGVGLGLPFLSCVSNLVAEATHPSTPQLTFTCTISSLYRCHRSMVTQSVGVLQRILLAMIQVYRYRYLSSLTLLMQGPTFAELLQPFPRVEAWLARVADSAEPHWTNATAILRKVVLRGRDAKLKRGQSKL